MCCTSLPHTVASSLAGAFLVDQLYRTVTLPDIVGLIVLTKVRRAAELFKVVKFRLRAEGHVALSR